MALKMVVFILIFAAAMAATGAQPLAGCPNKCGDVDIPYPFGVGVQPRTSRNCFFDEPFKLTCNRSTLFFRDVPVSNISLQEGQMDISMPVSKICYDHSGVNLDQSTSSFYTGAFTISNTQNKFISLGCDTLGVISFLDNLSYSGGCVTLCDTPPPKDINQNTCSGTGCCQVNIPVGKNNFSLEVSAVNNHAKVLGFNNCSYAFLSKQGWFNFSLDYLQSFPFDMVPFALDWTISNLTCQTASTSTTGYACKSNSYCVDSHDGVGYNCKCKTGFEGNPYHPDGCHDVDECSRPNNCSIPKQCSNFDGGYNCSCPPRYKGDGYTNGTGCTLEHRRSKYKWLVVIVALGFSVALLAVFTLVSSLCWAHKRRTVKNLKQRNFEQNGGYMLLRQLSQQQGYAERTKIFTEVELKNATNNFHEGRIIGRGGQCIVYKGILPVYEFVENGTLLDHIDPMNTQFPLSWETRLRIATETAEAISYLHSTASIPIVHRDIKSANILLDCNFKAKVSDFGASRLVPLDESHASTVVQGTFGYLDPEYLHTGQLNEKSDVYSFGVVLVELLTGSKVVKFNRLGQVNLAMSFESSMKENRLWEVLDKQVLAQKNVEQLKEVALLARKCIRVKGEERPTMKEISKELEGLAANKECLLMKSDEREYSPAHVPDRYGEAAACESIHKQMAFGTEVGR
ncbi:wall-associated receptor kinase 2-like [Neltuma alba]|uniref:wall-associated receptor kinase 2-like n=1 Tax=Neltuma alba TaxID=207710 RepID=UPI0010A2E165|nr:wall-associated receptor kinase 2-like [Prosopis alba]